MKKIYQYGLSAALLLGGLSAQAQTRPDGPRFPLGKTQALVRQLEAQVAAKGAGSTAGTITLRVAANRAFVGKVNFRQDLANTGEYVMGELQGVPGSSFQLRIEGGKVDGNIILRNTRQAFRYGADAQGNVTVQEVDIDRVICIDYNKPVGLQNPVPTKTKTKAQSELSGNALVVLSLQSAPGARGCVLLDFDGYNMPAGKGWNNGNAYNAPASGIENDAAQVQAFWELVSEDFRPFSMNVTTDENVFNSYPTTMRMRCVVSPGSGGTIAPGAGGVAYLTSFKDPNDVPCWVFMSDPKAGGEAASHEVGHTLGLAHDGRVTPSEGYYGGQGNWAPIMGVGYYKPITHWSRGEYASANNTEDDLAIMTSATYNVGYRNDDHSNGTGAATGLARNGTSLSGSGVIERTGDQDFFSFTAGAGTVSLNINTVGRYGNLDIVARLYNSGGGLIGTYDAGGLNTALSVNVAAGTYYLSVDGIGFGSPATDGYSDYGSLGTFSISGTAPVGTAVAGVATMYKDCSYGGTAVSLPAGDYNLAALQSRGILNDDISSLQVNAGYEVQLFADDNFTGTSLVVTASNSCLVGNNFNDIATSVRVRTAGVAAQNIPGTIQAESFTAQSGTQTEPTTDAGGGVNVDYFETNDWLDYRVNVATAGAYTVGFRVASAVGGATLQLRNNSGGVLGSVNVGNTGGWQSWQTITTTVTLPAGVQTLRVHASASTGCNLNFLAFGGGTTPATSQFLEAEAANVNNGFIAEACSEGGQNMAYNDNGDYLVWNAINFPTTGSYLIEYRVSSGGGGGTVSADLNAGAIQLGNTTVPGTGGWQNWTTVSRTVTINAGTYNFGIYSQVGGWNLNWVRITRVAAGSVAKAAGATPAAVSLSLSVYPNPVTDRLTLSSEADLTGEQVRILSVEGRVVWQGKYTGELVDVSALKPGLYTLVVSTKDQHKLVSRFSKQ